ncbi:Copine, partial [Cooperia oncophora]
SNSFRNVSPEEAATGIRVSIQEHYEPDNSYIEIAQTETVIGQTNVTFQHRCSLNYRFDKLERLKFSVYCVKDDNGSFLHRIGEVYTDVATVLANKGVLSLPLSPSAAIDVFITVPDFYAHHVKLKFRGNHLQVREHLPLAAYMILVLRIEKRTILLYKSEVVKEKNPNWREFSVPVYVIQFYTQGALQIHVYNQNVNAADTLIGFCSTSMAQLERGVGALNSYMLMNFDGKRIHEKMSIELESMELGRGEAFFDAIKNSTHLHLTTAIDMTASNGNPNQPDSLHFIHPHAASPYVAAMLRLTPLFLGYMAHSRIGALGFGARTEPRFELSQCFSLFAKELNRDARACTLSLLILTDGGLTNPRRTIEAIVDCSPHPMSIIAVGIGKNFQFVPFDELDSDDAVALIPLQIAQWRNLVSEKP